MSQPSLGIEPRPDWYIHQSKGPGVLAAIITVTAIGFVFTLTRLFVRAAVHRKPLPDDYIIVFSMICCFTSVAFGVLAIHSGSGRHFDLLSSDQKSKVILWSICGFVPGVFSVAFPKFAIVYLISRLLCPTRFHLVLLWTITGMAFILLSGCYIILFVQCTPIQSQWDFSIKGECLDPQILANVSAAASAYSAFVDFYLVAYPATILFRLQLSYDKSDLLIWTLIESNALVTAASFPILEPIYDFLRGVEMKKRGPILTGDSDHHPLTFHSDDEIFGVMHTNDVKVIAAYKSRKHRHLFRHGQRGSSLGGT
ncbi:major facilitator superfamily transporter [Apiospora arundinis]